MEGIIKNDMFFKTVDKAADEAGAVAFAKLIGQDTLQDLAREIAKLHKPIVMNFAEKFGLTAQTSPTIAHQNKETTPINSSTAKIAEKPVKQEATKPVELNEQAGKAKQKLVCHSCAEPVPYNVAKFCWFNKPKFGGNVYCVDCQKKVQLST